ncbi:Thiamin diphosphate-binding protein [Tilletiaria anomala UBC 951]|uniref:Thiamin diphosphate-binding protein n=1 Tax=Tilletiaria anomala (strain ATCC 24038 / CBS 436.72 / UBC 951) TaxID=1037660 RepID=A0A066WEM3_TILAU|nr:thiamine diphosphate-binding protein [Tilletiaria anomala UBC 951]KDN52367.1 Thiamin diphosphate-binding protein [Tilletiaria anomala UBC 951]
MSSSAGTRNSILLSEYLLSRLEQLNVPVIQGVPGDYSLGLLSQFLDHHAKSGSKQNHGINGKAPEWIGNANELNATYSADGLARVLGPQRPSVVVTTMGVGELSAANGIAGCYSERIPVIHIVGTPTSSAQEHGLLLHHTLGDHKFVAFGQIARQITAAQLDFALLKREGRMQLMEKDSEGTGEDAARELDRILEVCVRQALPVYIALPSDLVHFPLPASCKHRLTEQSLQTGFSPNKADSEAYVLRVITDKVTNAKCPVILVDACTLRHNVVKETRALVASSGLPIFTTPMGKTAVDESDANPQYGGVYIGSISSPEVKEVIEEKADLIIAIGTLQSDFNTGNFSYRTRRESTIELHSDRICVAFATYEGVRMKGLLPKLTDALKKHGRQRLEKTEELLRVARRIPTFNNKLPTPQEELSTFTHEQIGAMGGSQSVTSSIISQAYLWPRVGQFLRPGDRVIGETGTSAFGLMEVRFPRDAQFLAQVLWGSIGWSCPATLGVSLGMRELTKQGDAAAKQGRTILFIGDGSLQLTLQEIGTMIRQGLTPLIFVLNNDGYEIERQIHGAEASYNDIQPYNHSLLLDLLRPPPNYRRPTNPSHASDPEMSKTAYHATHTKAELHALLKDEEFNKADKCTLVEVFMPRGDAPAALRRQAEMSSSTNA